MYSYNLLDAFRLQTDLDADEVITQIFSLKNPQLLAQMSKEIHFNSDIYDNNLPEFIQTFFQTHAQMPAWADARKMQQGFDLFAKHTELMLSMLGFYSLPYCYAAEFGVQVLYFSQRIAQDTIRRLTETAQFVLDVTQRNAFEPKGKGFASILKVRLMHATVRYHIAKSSKWEEKWGKPINQEDMAGTNLAFSLIPVRGLRKIGVMVSMQEAESYQHLWNVIGALLGVDEKLLPEDSRAAFWLDKRIAERHFRASEAGTFLTQQLIQAFENNPQASFPKGFALSFMRYLLGSEMADLLQVPSANWTANLLPLVFQSNLMQNFFPLMPNPMKGGQILNNLQKELQQDPVNFTPPHQF